MSRVVATPVFHAAAAPTTHFGALRGGYPTFIMRRFDLNTFLITTEKYDITDAILVPPIAVAILMNPYTRTRPFLKKLKGAGCGAAPLGRDVQAKFHELMDPSAPLTQVWGMTETSCIATFFPYPEHDDTGSVGRLIPNLEAKLIDLDGNNISAYGVRGELCVRGPTVTQGYYNNPEANASSFDSDGWYKTGDVAYCDEATRKWYIVDRRKELIKVRGFQVAPAELESVLLLHPNIVDVAVIGVKEPGTDDELPRAYVVRRPTAEGKKLAEADVKAYVAERLAKYKALTGGVRFLDAIPKNPTGKILKKVLKEEASKESGETRAKL